MPVRAQPAVALADAVLASEPLARLSQRLRESNQRYACILASLPGHLAAQTRPGPIDASSWTLLTDNAAVAAKLRQLVPLIETQLAQQGQPALPLRIRVRGR
jgi:hypothetical protein